MSLANNTTGPDMKSLAYVLILVGILLVGIGIARFSATGYLSGGVGVSVTNDTTIAFVTGTIDFGNLAVSSTNNTTDGNPPAFEVRNDGNVPLNITVLADDDLWASDANPTANFQVACGNTSEDNCDPGSQRAFTNMPTTAATIIYDLASGASNDQLEIEINITVPSGETGGVKNSTITVAAVDCLCG